MMSSTQNGFNYIVARCWRAQEFKIQKKFNGKQRKNNERETQHWHTTSYVTPRTLDSPGRCRIFLVFYTLSVCHLVGLSIFGDIAFRNICFFSRIFVLLASSSFFKLMMTAALADAFTTHTHIHRMYHVNVFVYASI